MTLLTRAVSTYKAPNPTRRLPQSAHGGAGFGLFGGGGSSGGMLAQMQAYGSVGWLFAVVDRIAENVAASEWHLYDQQANGERVGVETHPALDLWRDINPFFTRNEFLETSQQHLELVGEAWWVLASDGSGSPREMWPVRPDRIMPVPDDNAFVLGYIYRHPRTGERIPLELDEVIFLRKPNPMDPYRGAGVVQAILTDLEGERFAAQWHRNFFYNSAEPGGIIEFPEALDQEEWEKLVLRWREQHQGVNNAHRVAIIEGGKWVDRKYTQRDMQFEATRKLNRDLILGAFGFPHAILGITDSVNRSNAEAAEVMFARQILRPRLERIKQSLNERFLPKFGDARKLSFDYVDPSPENREAKIREGVLGFKAGLLTQNEGRRRMGEDDLPGGDAFAYELIPDQKLTVGTGLDQLGARRTEVKVLAKAEDTVPALERLMLDRWAERLATEAEAIAAHLEQFKQALPITANADALALASYRAAGLIVARLLPERVKLEASDAYSYDWDWWERYSEEVLAELERTFLAAILAFDPDNPPLPTLAQQRAVDFARTRAAQLLRLDGDANLARLTRERVRVLVAETIEQGDSLQTLQRRIREDFAFSRARAECLLPETPITSAAVNAVFRRWYEGNVVEIITAGGRHLTATPNHPHLTSRGWLSTQDITPGDYLLCHVGDEYALPARDTDVQWRPPTIAQIFDALPAVGVMERRPTRQPDFHGDGGEGYVDILRPNGVLEIGHFAPLYKPVIDELLTPADAARAPYCLSCGRLLAINEPVCGCAAPGLYSGLSQVSDDQVVARVQITADASDGFPGLVARRDPVRVQVAPAHVMLTRPAPVGPHQSGTVEGLPQRRGGHLSSPSSLIDREAGEVHRDRVLSVRVKRYEGHVFNLSTPYGYFRASGLYTGNTIARTESATAQGQGEKAAALIQGREEKRWLTAGDELVDAAGKSTPCLDNEAAGWIGASELFPSGHDTIPAHIRCLPGDSRVSAQGVSAASQRWYDGDLVIIRTASGKQLSCTPNHPILTPQGWIGAGLLDEGGYVISSGRREWMAGEINLDHEDMPPRIQDIAEAFRRSEHVLTMPVPTTPEDFHGDGRGSKIAVIWTNRLLGDDGDATLPQHRGQGTLTWGDMQSFGLDRLGMGQPRSEWDGPALGGSVGGRDLASSLLGRHARPFQGFGFALATYGHAALEQAVANDSSDHSKMLCNSVLGPATLVEADDFSNRNGDSGSGKPSVSSYANGLKPPVEAADADAHLARQILSGAAGPVFSDQIVHIEWTRFRGHVYNLETASGAYIADGIVTHNCRCVVLWRHPPVSDVDPAEGLGDGRMLAEARCPKCAKLLGTDMPAGLKLWCRRCKLDVTPMKGVEPAS